MKHAFTVLFIVAKELAESAKNSLPKLREGEFIKHEWLKGSIYCRETVFNEQTYQAIFDFGQRTSRINKVSV